MVDLDLEELVPGMEGLEVEVLVLAAAGLDLEALSKGVEDEDPQAGNLDQEVEGFEPEELGLKVLVQAAVEGDLAQQEVEMAVEELFQEVPSQEEAGIEVLIPVGEVVVAVLPTEVASMLNQELQNPFEPPLPKLNTTSLPKTGRWNPAHFEDFDFKLL